MLQQNNKSKTRRKTELRAFAIRTARALEQNAKRLLFNEHSPRHEDQAQRNSEVG